MGLIFGNMGAFISLFTSMLPVKSTRIRNTLQYCSKNKNMMRLLGCVIFCLVVWILHHRREEAKPSEEKLAFTNNYLTNKWINSSGRGSIPKNAMPFINYVQSFIITQPITSIVDIGCGDWELMKLVNIPESISYLGIDLVEHVIAFNIKHYSRKNIHFKTVNHLKELSTFSGDLLIIKDVIQHWSNTYIFEFLRSVLPRFKYAIICHDIEFGKPNADIKPGNYRPVNITDAPFFVQAEVVQDFDSDIFRKRIWLYTRDHAPLNANE